MNICKLFRVFVYSLALTFSITLVIQGQPRLLGQVEFPNSGSSEAQEDFIEGLLFLHNFEYRDAAISFRSAQEKDPEFAMAYWGEAMTKNQPIWHLQQRDEAVEILNKMAPTPEDRRAMVETEREKMYLNTLEMLFGTIPETENLTKEERDFRYRDALNELLDAYPEDDEARSFYGLSILGTAHEGRDFRIYMEAAAELMPVWEQNKKHPGAAHYLIHSFDDSIHAPLGLPMAEAYSEIAPDAAHAQHMVSHIFLELGMWDEVVTANETASEVEIAREKELGESTTVCGHNLYWLVYGYTQVNRYDDSADIINTCYERIQNEQTNRNLWHFAMMRARYVIDTEEWSRIDKWAFDYDVDTSGSIGYFYTNAFTAIKNGDNETAKSQIEILTNIQEENPGDELNTMLKQLEGMLEFSEKPELGLEKLQEAAKMEQTIPLSYGPPSVLKPSLELLGEYLLEHGKTDEAVEAFQKQLELTPNRSAAEKGLSNANQQLTRTSK